MVPGEEGERLGASGRIHLWQVLIGVALVQALLLIFNASGDAGNWFSRFFAEADYGYHYYFSARLAEAVRLGGESAGYDPNMFAGMDIWPQVAPPDRLTVTLFTYTPQAWWPAVFNLMFLTKYVLMAVLFVLAMYRFGVRGTALTASGMFGLFLFWIGLPSFLRRGISSFPFACVFAFWIASEVYALTSKFSHRRAALVVASTVFSVYVHPAMVFVTPLFVFSVLAFRWREIDRRLLWWAGAAAILTPLVNWPWIRLMFMFDYSRVQTDSALTFTSLQHFIDFQFKGGIHDGIRVFLPAILAVASLALAHRTGALKGLVRWSAVMILLFTFLFVFGSFLPAIKQMQPMRFNVGIKLMAACHVSILVAAFLASNAVRRPMLIAAGVVGLVPLLYAVQRVQIIKTYTNHPLMEVREMLKSQTPSGSRILLIRGPEDPSAPPIEDEQCILGSYLDREWLGTEWIVPTLAKYGHEKVANLNSLRRGDATIEEWQEFRNLLHIEYVLYPTEHVDRYAGWSSGLDELARAGGYVLLAGGAPATHRFVEGSGRVAPELNRLTFSDVKPGPQGSIAVAYHHSVGFKLIGAPKSQIRRRTYPMDSYGLLEITNPPESFAVVFDLAAVAAATEQP